MSMNYDLAHYHANNNVVKIQPKQKVVGRTLIEYRFLI